MYYWNSAGGWNKAHEQVEQTPRVDSFDLGNIQGWSNTACGSRMIDVFFTEPEDGCILASPDGPDEQEIQVEAKPNGYGGEQLFFICPECGARVRFLYLEPDRFSLLCRECMGLNYGSQQNTKDSMFYYRKGMEYAEKYLAVPPYAVDGFEFTCFVPERPKRMRKSTYDKHLARFLEYRRRFTEQMRAEAMKILTNTGDY